MHVLDATSPLGLDQQIDVLTSAEEGLDRMESSFWGRATVPIKGGMHGLLHDIRRDVQAVKYALTSQKNCDDAVPRAPEPTDEVVVDIPDPMPTAVDDSREKLRKASQAIGDVGLKMEALSELCEGNGGMENTDGLGLLVGQLAQEILAAQADIAGTI